jgi:hypothetical protein
MSEAAKKILEDAMRLPADERGLIARRLLESVQHVGMDPVELEELEAALEESERQFAAGEGRGFFEAIVEARSRSV